LFGVYPGNTPRPGPAEQLEDLWASIYTYPMCCNTLITFLAIALTSDILFEAFFEAVVFNDIFLLSKPPI
jgi:hypothetical protein